jgi:hypothetical protein
MAWSLAYSLSQQCLLSFLILRQNRRLVLVDLVLAHRHRRLLKQYLKKEY